MASDYPRHWLDDFDCVRFLIIVFRKLLIENGEISFFIIFSWKMNNCNLLFYSLLPLWGNEKYCPSLANMFCCRTLEMKLIHACGQFVDMGLKI